MKLLVQDRNTRKHLSVSKQRNSNNTLKSSFMLFNINHSIYQVFLSNTNTHTTVLFQITSNSNP